MLQVAKETLRYKYHAQVAAITAKVFLTTPSLLQGMVFEFHKKHVFKAHDARVRAEQLLGDEHEE